MKLSELVAELQSLCNQGYEEMKVEINLSTKQEAFTECTVDLLHKIITIG